MRVDDVLLAKDDVPKESARFSLARDVCGQFKLRFLTFSSQPAGVWFFI